MYMYIYIYTSYVCASSPLARSTAASSVALRRGGFKEETEVRFEYVVLFVILACCLFSFVIS